MTRRRVLEFREGVQAGQAVVKLTERNGAFCVAILGPPAEKALATLEEALLRAEHAVAFMSNELRYPCPACARHVGLTRFKLFAAHKPEPRTPGRKQPNCPGGGLKPQL